MSDAKLTPRVLHGPYDYGTAFLDAALVNGAVTINTALNEAAIKLLDDWYYIQPEKDGKEGELFKMLTENTDILTNCKITVEYNYANSSGTESINILGIQVDAASTASKAPKEDYLLNKEFGTF